MGIGMGALDPDQKYVVLFEIYGPVTKSSGDNFDTALTDLMAEYGGLIQRTWHASKSAVDPVAFVLKPPPKHGKSGKPTKKKSKRPPASG